MNDTVPHATVQLQWTGCLRFALGRPGEPVAQVDGDAKVAPGPFDLLLGAVAACACTDVVTILEKGRTPVQWLEVQIEATRIQGTPRRLASAVLHFTIRGKGITPAQVERAVMLSVTKYCSVRSSLAADIPVTWTVELLPQAE